MKPSAEIRAPRGADALRKGVLRFSLVNSPKLTLGSVPGLLKDTFKDWMEDGALRLSAALAYYSVFSIAPLLVIVLGLAGWASSIAGPGKSNEFIYSELGKVLGPQSLETVRSMVESASGKSAGFWATMLGLGLLLLGASGVFAQLKDALNTIWEVKAKSGLGVKIFIRQRLLSFGMVLVIGFLLLLSFLLTTGVSAFGQMIFGNLPLQWLWSAVALVVSFATVTALFAFIFKVLPDAEIEWRHVWVGAVVTALLFELGKWGLGLYLGRESTASSYGAAAGVILLLLWVYYGSCILFFGAEFTQVYAKAMGHEIRANKFAEPVTAEMRAQEGLTPCKRETPPAPPTPAEFVAIPVYTPPAAPRFPSRVSEVPDYLRESPAASLVTALGCGLAVGALSRLLARRRTPSPVEEIAHGSRALTVAATALAAGAAKRLWSEAAHSLSAKMWQKAGARLRQAVLPLLLVCTTIDGQAAEKAAAKGAASDKILRLQVFLDGANFGPGKIDGRDGEFTRKALALYRKSVGKEATPDGGALDAAGLDIAESESPFTEYQVTEADVKAAGEIPKERAAQTKLEWLPYRTVLEGVAEKFHADVDYVKELNPDAKGDLKAGDTVKVPNVKPFDLATVKTMPIGGQIASTKGGANELNSDDDDKDAAVDPGKVSINVNTAESMLTVREGDEIRAAFPLTSGSERTASPVGKWKIRGIARLPEFRWDEKMLKEGERSADFLMLPPGPNNPVGIFWIALNKKGIGIHGTEDPDSIGRSASHGCIRLANWDVAKLAQMVKAGVPVTIE